MKNNKVILIYEANECELPVTLVKNPVEACAWLGCTRKTIYNMLKNHSTFNGYAIEIILL